jgi:hypothetical protein
MRFKTGYFENGSQQSQIAADGLATCLGKMSVTVWPRGTMEPQYLGHVQHS